MNRANIIVTAIVVTVIGSYFGYLGYKKSQKTENVFAEASKVRYESLAIDPRNQDLFKYSGSPYSEFMLPHDLQQKIKLEQIKSHIRIQAMLKEYITRMHIHLKDPKVTTTNLDPEKVPPLTSLIEGKVKNSEVEKIYNQNLAKFPKGHDPLDIKQQIKFNLMSQEALKLISVFLTEVYYEKGLELSSYPQFKEKWLNLGTSTKLSQDQRPYNITWIGKYGCEKCDQFNHDLGLIIKKYGEGTINLTFIPYSTTAMDAFQQINLAALCYKKVAGVDEFWKFHAQSMSRSKQVSSIKPSDFKASKKFITARLKSLGKLEDQSFLNEFNACAYNLDLKKNPVFERLVLVQRKLKNFGIFDESSFLLNGRLLDLEGRRLLLAVDQKLKEDQ